jgi:integrase
LFYQPPGQVQPAISAAHVISHSLASVIAELETAKTVANRRPKYVTGLRQYLDLFARGRELTPIASIGVREIEAWFASRTEAPSTRASNLGRLSALFGFAVRRGYLSENPVKRLETIFLERSAPLVLSPAQARLALVTARREFPRFVPWLALALFAGVRPEELDQIAWANVDLDRGLVTIDAAVSKVRRRRAMPLPAAAVAWLKLGGDLPIPHVSRRRYIRRLRTALGWAVWPQDVLRHTAASYLLSEHQDAPKVALWLGNSVKILLAHYHEVVGGDTAREFWAIRPESDQSELF